MKQLRSFESLSSVLATFRNGTPLKAASTLACAPSTVYRAIERLEKDVGEPLFDRAPSGWVATEIGECIIGLAERIEAEISGAELLLLSKSRSFPAALRLSASDGFAVGYLGPVLAAFSILEPQLAVELISDNRFADLARREADVAIRPDRRPGDGLVGRRAGKLAHALYCADALLAQYGTPNAVSELTRFNVCMLRPELEHFTGVSWWNSLPIRKQIRVSLTTSSEMGLAAALAAGAGIGVLPCYLGDKLAGVRRVTNIVVSVPVDIWIVSHPALRANPVVRALIRALADAMRRDASRFNGTK